MKIKDCVASAAFEVLEMLVGSLGGCALCDRFVRGRCSGRNVRMEDTRCGS